MPLSDMPAAVRSQMASALDEARRTRFDLIIVDYMMPGIDGLTLIREVRSLPDYVDVPIVMVTTVDQREICYAALEAGATDFLTKPVDMAEAKARLRNLAILCFGAAAAIAALAIGLAG